LTQKTRRRGDEGDLVSVGCGCGVFVWKEKLINGEGIINDRRVGMISLSNKILMKAMTIKEDDIPSNGEIVFDEEVQHGRGHVIPKSLYNTN
jgi:hypothetical protein